MSLAGWSLGRLRAVKLCQSSSISGPSEIINPIALKISTIFFLTTEIGCLLPKLFKKTGLLKSINDCFSSNKESELYFLIIFLTVFLIG